jgi:hypothetical protein
MRDLYCTICEKYYNTSRALWNHNKRYHNTIDTSVKVRTKSNIIKCNYCKTQFAHTSSKYKHQKNCKENPENIKTKIVIDNPLESENNGITKSVVNLASQIIANPSNGNKDSNNNNNENNSSLNSHSYNKTHSDNKTNSDNKTHSDNKTNSDNINIAIISLGNENITDTLTAQEQQNIIKQANKSLEELIKIVHFNKKYPQFQNIAINDDRAYAFSQSDAKFIEQPKDDLIYDIIKHRVHDLHDINDEHKIYLPKKSHTFMNTYIKMFKTNDHYERHAKKIEKVISKGTNDLLSSKKMKL